MLLKNQPTNDYYTTVQLYRDFICKLNDAEVTRAEVQLGKLAIPKRFTLCIS